MPSQSVKARIEELPLQERTFPLKAASPGYFYVVVDSPFAGPGTFVFRTGEEYCRFPGGYVGTIESYGEAVVVRDLRPGEKGVIEVVGH